MQPRPTGVAFFVDVKAELIHACGIDFKINASGHPRLLITNKRVGEHFLGYNVKLLSLPIDNLFSIFW